MLSKCNVHQSSEVCQAAVLKRSIAQQPKQDLRKYT